MGFAEEPESRFSSQWDLEPGQVLPRKAVHDRFGGSRQNGICPLSQSSNILLFSLKSGKEYGYHIREGWLDANTYLYTGDGAVGDQQFAPGTGNLAIRDHAVKGKALRLFVEEGRTATSAVIVKYVGQFTLDEDLPYFFDTAPDRNGNDRSVIMFRLRSVVAAVSSGGPPVAPGAEVLRIPLEAHVAKSFVISATTSEVEAEKVEAGLVERFGDWLKQRGHEVGRQQIRFAGGLPSLYTDLYDFTLQRLVEAKGSASRNHVRLAIGQLLDYERYLKPLYKAVLLPRQPHMDLVLLMYDLRIDCIWEAERGDFELQLSSSLLE